MQLISLDTDDFFKRTLGVDEKQASVTGNTTKQSVYKKKQNPVLLQEEEENIAEETNYDAYVNVEANKVHDKNNDMVVTMKEEKNNLKYQETMNLDIENIFSKK